MKKFLLIIIFLLGIISSVYAAANNETGDKSAVPISVYGKTADGTVTAILVDDEGKLVIEGGSGGGSGDSLWTDYGAYISQDATRSGDNVWIQNDLSVSNNLSVYGTVDGRDISADGAKLDGIEVGAEVNTVDSVNGYVGVIVLTTGDVNVSTDKNYVTDTQLVVLGNTIGVNTGDQDLSDYLSKSTSFVGDVTGTYNSTVVGNDSHSHTNATITLASTDLTDTADLLYEAELDTFSELQTQIADKTLVNEEDAVTWDSTSTFNGQIVSNNDLTISENTSATGTLYYVLMDINGDIMGRSAETHPISSGGGSGTPGGSDGDIQYNNGGSFGGFGNYNDGTDVLELSGDLTVSGDTQIHSDLTVDGVIFGGNSNYIAGLDVDYASTTSVTVSSGRLIVNDALVSVDLTTHTIINYDNGGFTYLYVDSTGEVSDSATEPTEHLDGTWYNGNDRCIGSLYCDSAATIEEFTYENGSYYFATDVQIASSMDPTGTWQIPDDFESSLKLPVNAKIALIKVYVIDTASQVNLYVASYEYSEALDNVSNCFNSLIGYNSSFLCSRVTLGSTRNIRIAAADNDDNGTLSAWISGYKIRR